MDERVEAGATLLDERWQNWHNAIDLENLDIQSAERCVLGQIFGDYWNGKAKLGIGSTAGANYGFDAVHDLWTEAPVLNEAWRGAVMRRRRADAEVTAR